MGRSTHAVVKNLCDRAGNYLVFRSSLAEHNLVADIIKVFSLLTNN